ncbi:acid protease [Delitschia confertaspora ATCC 74209]|uniref:Acid protease n=1 Tax=Delitschia confertaspora ATCC 74209 TaxID=1513339 RepID=A0A9P4MWF1_9PLEO|nr:acid protease [Delitschia confertaspora ATCC 74209]
MKHASLRSVWLFGIFFCPSLGRTLERDDILSKRDTNKTAIPAPIVASVSQYWEGNDGPWSTFALQIGQKPQPLRLLPSTSSSFTYVVTAPGCPPSFPQNCPDSRGNLFNSNNSLTWIPNSIFQLGLSENLGVNINGDFGFDTVTLGWQGSGGPSVEHSIVAGIGDARFSWLGGLGLNPRPTNFSTFPNNPQVSFLQALFNEKKIPSLSWSYTAGAPYRLDKVFGSLVFGGYDASRFSTPGNASLTFPFYEDISRDLQVGISSITTSNTTNSATPSTLLSEGIYAFIDSTIPHLILPESVCRAFESAFGLTLDSTSNLYLLNASQHSALAKLNPSVTISLVPSLLSSPAGGSNSRVDITLPYSSFNLNISYPHTNASTYYFPLKRAANETQYTLGRTFLQEAYLIADYEHGNFSVWPCKWDGGTKDARIVAIRSVNETVNDEKGKEEGSGGGEGGKGLSGGKIAGIAVGIAAVIAGGIVGIFFFLRRRRRNSVDSGLPLNHLAHNHEYALHEAPSEEVGEMDGAGYAEMEGGKVARELDGAKQIVGELEGKNWTYELVGEGHEKGGARVHELAVQEKGGKMERERVYELDAGPH